MQCAKRKQEEQRSIVVNPEINIVETVDLDTCKRRQHRNGVIASRQGVSGGQDYVERSRNYAEHGRPCYHRFGRSGGLKRGKTVAISLKGSRESDSLIVVMNPAKADKCAERVERRGELSRELVLREQAE